MGFALAEQGHKVLLVDFDPQANLTMSFGIDSPDELKMSMSNLISLLMENNPLPDKSQYILKGPTLDIIPSNINLSVTEINLRDEMSREHILSEMLEPLRSEYRYIIIDTNPYLGLLTINALAACDEVIIPASPQLWSATGLADLINTVVKLQRKINPRIKFAGILLTICDERTRLFREAKKLLDDTCGENVRIFKTHIPNTIRVGEATYSNKSILDYDANSKASIAYKAFAQEVINYGD